MRESGHGFSFAPGHILEGRFRLEELLGEGGFGAVYRATQLNINREVAIKVVLPQLLAMQGGLERFLREARVAQRLEHPNTVRMYDFGHTDDGTPFIAWELLRGKPLDEALKNEGPMSPDRVVRIISQSLKALMEAHSLGIVHRDIKPANIYLSTFSGEPDFVKVLDFGIAKALDATEESGGKNLTMAGQIIGTPSYMSPEQVKGESIGPRSDIYSLGLVMAEMLSGSVVYAGTGLAICAAHLSPSPTPLPQPIRISPLGAIIMRATQKDPSVRYQSAEEMLNDVKRTGAEIGSDAARTPAGGFMPGSGQWSGGLTPLTPAPISGSIGQSQITPRPIVTGQIVPPGAPKKNTTFLLVLAGILGTLVVFAVLVIVGVAFLMDDDEEGSVATGNATTTGNFGGYGTGNSNTGGTGPTTPAIYGNLAALHSDLIVSRLQEQGFSLLQQPQVQNSGVVNTTVVTGLRGSTAATVMLYQYSFQMGIEAMEQALRQQNQGAVFSDGSRLLYVVVSGQGGGPIASQQLGQQILR
jgi:serine/threonine-protein kinase